MSHTWTDAPKSAAAKRLLRKVQDARSFDDIDEVLGAAQVRFARQEMADWEMEGIRKFARFQRESVKADLAKGIVKARTR